MAGHLLLGPVLFRDFELPERISWGGAQRMRVHRLPGGGRVIDAMGRDDAPIAWSGVFAGEDGAMRARLLDLMRADGATWPLTWDSFLYSVVIQAFSVSYERANWMPYRIVCTVLRDEAEGFVEDLLSLTTEALGDLTLAEGAGSGLDFSVARDALGASGAGVRGTPAYGGALGGLGALALGADGAMGAADGRVSRAGFGDAAGLRDASGAAGELAATAQARGYSRRALVNLRNADS